MADTYLTRTPSSSSNRKTFTWSGWIKRSQLGATNTLFTSGYSSNAVASLRFNASDKLDVFDYNSSTQFAVVTNRLFRDTSAWYHIVMRVDTTQSTANDRVRLYVNGEQETSLTTNTQPSQNYDTLYNGGVDYYIGRYGWTNADSFNGSMSHIHFCDGQSYAPTEFGETDATTGQWKIKTSPSVTYGTNGFFILKDGNSVTDQSGNSNNFTVGGGTLTKTEDNPSNVFATFSPLIKATTTFSNGNTTGQTQNSSNYLAGMSTLGMPRGSGIYYCEIKLISESATGESCIGVACEEAFTLRDAGTLSIVGADYNWGIRNANGLEYVDGGSSASKHGNFTVGDIMGVYFDSTNDKLTYSKNGGWWNGTSSWTGTSPDLTNYFVGTSSGSYQTFFFNCGDAGNSVNAKWSANFGNGSFGTTAVSSAGTNTSGQIGIFEYNMPTNSKVLSTKGLNT